MKHCLWVVGMLVVCVTVQAASLKDNMDQAESIQKDAQKSQQKIDNLASESEQMLEEYRRLLADSEYQAQYLVGLKNLDQQQQKTLDSLQTQLDEVQFTQRRMGPLLKTMLDTLEQFIVLDLPFHHQERINAVLALRSKIEDGSLSFSQKYRLIMEAYQIELAYGESLEAYRGRVNLNDESFSVEYLRVGRLALYYQTLDGQVSAMWDKQSNGWKTLDAAHARSLTNGIRVAKSQVAPQLLTLPVVTQKGRQP